MDSRRRFTEEFRIEAVKQITERGLRSRTSAGNGGGAQPHVFRNKARIDQWARQKDEGRGVAAWVGQPLGRANPLPLAITELRQAINPGGVSPEGGARINNSGRWVGYHGRGLARGGIGQAEEH